MKKPKQYYEIQFLNWKQIQGRGTEHERTSWFKIPNNINEDPVVAALSGNQFRTYILLMAAASRRDPRGGSVIVPGDPRSTDFHYSRSSLGILLGSLRDLGIIKFQVLNYDPRDPRIDKKEENRKEDVNFLSFKGEYQEKPETLVHIEPVKQHLPECAKDLLAKWRTQ